MSIVKLVLAVKVRVDTFISSNDFEINGDLFIFLFKKEEHEIIFRRVFKDSDEKTK